MSEPTAGTAAGPATDPAVPLPGAPSARSPAVLVRVGTRVALEHRGVLYVRSCTAPGVVLAWDCRCFERPRRVVGVAPAPLTAALQEFLVARDAQWAGAPQLRATDGCTRPAALVVAEREAALAEALAEVPEAPNAGKS